MNIYTVKWGTKYSAEHVNKIHEACLEHVRCDFTFHCLTEDSRHLNEDINIISFPGGNDLIKWWNKMYLFDTSLVIQKGEKMFLDLDVILQKPIDCITNFDSEDCLAIVKTWWHDLETQYKNTRHIPHTYTDLNSSVLRWNDNFDSDSLYKYFLKHKQQILWYYRGLDNFFHHRKISKFKMFPIGWVYSFNQGYIFPHDIEKHVYRELPYVCIFDSMGKGEDVKF